MLQMPKFVDIESPYSAPTTSDLTRNLRYARACVRDCLLRGEVPFASHLFYTQPGILDDNKPDERVFGIMAGKAIIEKLNATTVVYTDLGTSRGMQLGIDLAQKSGRTIEYRSLGSGWEAEFSVYESKQSQNEIWGTAGK